MLTVVTGGSRGIGAAIARRLARAGHDVVITYKRNGELADGVAAEVRATGQRALVVQLDTSQERSVVDLFESVSQFGSVTGLVNNAGSATAIGRLEDNTLEGIRADVDIVLLGAIAMTKHAIVPLKRAGGGAIVNISSAAATLGSAGTYVHYAAAKAGIEALTKGLSIELAPDNIRVNAVSPGLILTDFHHDPSRLEALGQTVPMSRIGTPEEVAGAVSWLLSDEASYTTGAVLRVAGGR